MKLLHGILLLTPILFGCHSLTGDEGGHAFDPVGIKVMGDSDISEWKGYVRVTFPPSEVPEKFKVVATWTSGLKGEKPNFQHLKEWTVSSGDAKVCDDNKKYHCIDLPLPLGYSGGSLEGLVYARIVGTKLEHSLRTRRGKKSGTAAADPVGTSR